MTITKSKYHTNLSNYFSNQSHFFDGPLQKKPNRRKCTEQPWQQTVAEMWVGVTETLCDFRFKPEQKYIDTIKGILNNNHIGHEDSPCLKLPKETWDEPGLFSNCPKYEEAIRFNPFLVDNRDKY